MAHHLPCTLSQSQVPAGIALDQAPAHYQNEARRAARRLAEGEQRWATVRTGLGERSPFRERYPPFDDYATRSFPQVSS